MAAGPSNQAALDNVPQYAPAAAPQHPAAQEEAWYPPPAPALYSPPYPHCELTYEQDQLICLTHFPDLPFGWQAIWSFEHTSIMHIRVQLSGRHLEFEVSIGTS
jgi:hypothetical protein